MEEGEKGKAEVLGNNLYLLTSCTKELYLGWRMRGSLMLIFIHLPSGQCFPHLSLVRYFIQAPDHCSWGRRGYHLPDLILLSDSYSLSQEKCWESDSCTVICLRTGSWIHALFTYWEFNSRSHLFTYWESNSRFVICLHQASTSNKRLGSPFKAFSFYCSNTVRLLAVVGAVAVLGWITRRVVPSY